MAESRTEAFSLSHAAILNAATGAEESGGTIYGVRSASLQADIGTYDNTGDDTIRSTWYWLNYATVQVEAGFVPYDVMSLLSGQSIDTSGAATSAYIEFTPAAVGGANAFDYSANSQVFTLNAGAGEQVVTLDAAYTNLAGVVAAVDAALTAEYTVTSDSTKVKVSKTATGLATIYVGGPDASHITGSTGYANVIGTAGDTLSMLLWTEDSANQPPRPMKLTMPSKDMDGNARIMDIVLFKVQFSPFSFTGPQYKSGLLLNYSGRALRTSKDETGTALPGGIEAVGKIINRPQS